MTDLQIIITEDGSHSIFHPGLNETYHSRHGAVQESTHVFISSGLQFWLEQTKRNSVTIFEVGFGTGLNAWLTHEFTRGAGIKVNYLTVEAFPLPREIWSQLNYAGGDERYEQLHDAPWDVSVELDECFTLRKMYGRLEDVLISPPADVIYFDAFAPSKQPDLWTFSIVEKVCKAMARGGVFVTYCAKGQLKRDLRAIGLETESLAGPPGKKEMVRAILR